MTSTPLFQRNLDLFQQRFPAIHQKLAAIQSPVSQPIHQDEAIIDLNFGQQRLYGTNGRDLSRTQVDEFMHSPVQVGYWVPRDYKGDSKIFGRTFQDVVDSLNNHQVGTVPMRPVTFTGYAFVLGIGLGYHLPDLVERLNAPHFVFCEVFDEFLLGSLRTIDWQKLCETADALGKSIDIVLHQTPDALFEATCSLINHYGSVELDGSYFFTHYNIWALSETHRLLVNEFPRRMAALGYYEDERKMARNAATNLIRAKQESETFILPGRFVARRQIPAFLVGAGPSVDQCIDAIREWRDHVVLFSSGSALQVLLKNGIIPDYHTELENIYAIHTKLKHILDENAHLFPEGKFTGITLLGSVTLNPNVRQFFDRVAYFFRDEACSSHAFRGETDILTGPAPTVANTSMACAARMGFRTVYLFGYDCGWRNEDVHHAKDTIYYTSNDFKTKSMKGAFAMPGNFGGTIYSNMVFEWSRNMLEQAVRTFHMNAYNCSDGALLKGCTPKVADAIVLPGDPIDRQEVMAHGEGNFQSIAGTDYFADHDFDRYRRELDQIEGEITALLAESRQKDWLFADFNRQIVHLTHGTLSVRHFTLGRKVLFATHGIMKQAGVFLCRLEDEAKAKSVMADFLAHFEQVHQEMLAETRQFVDEFQSWAQGGPEPVWADGMPLYPGYTY